MESYGYATELEYVNDFISALNPLWIDFAYSLRGLTHPHTAILQVLIIWSLDLAGAIV